MRRLLIACAATALTSACTEPSPPASTTTSLSAPTLTPAARVPLVPVALATQADYDALEDRWLGRRSGAALLEVLKALADAQPKPDPLLLQRIAVLVADDIGRDRNALDASLQAGTRLRDAASAGDPHVLWFNGWVLWQFLTVSGSVAVDDPNARDLATAAIKQWKELLAAAPAYVGPRKQDAGAVRQAIARLEGALAEAAAAPVAAPSMHVASTVEIDALSLLARFASAPDGGRRGICRDWSERERASAPTSAERRVDLACAILEGASERALTAIAGLHASDGPAFDACAALARLRERAPPAELSSALGAHPLPIACP